MSGVDKLQGEAIHATFISYSQILTPRNSVLGTEENF